MCEATLELSYSQVKIDFMQVAGALNRGGVNLEEAELEPNI